MNDSPKATHYGVWILNEEKDVKIECYVMDTRERVLSLRGAARTMGLVGNGSQALARNLNAQWIAPFLSEGLKNWLEKANRNELPTYRGVRGQFMPFEASLFVDLCKAYVDALHAGVLQTEKQKQIAERLYAIMTAFAKTGLVAVATMVSLSSFSQDLIARQAPIDKKLKTVDSLALQKQIRAEQSEYPALSLYPNWNNQYVHAYGNAIIPDTYTIDLTGFHMPTPSTKITSPFGPRWRRMHNGLDLKVNIGDTIVAAFDGKVRIVKYERRGYGKYVVIRHDNGLETVYGHLSKQLVEENQLVKAGEVIGLGGNTGRSTGSHLHFETRFLGIAINPIYMFDFPKQDIVADTYTFRRTQGSSKRAGSHDTQVADGTIRYHKVKSGDTLSRIAKLRGVSVSTLCKLNRIKPTTTLRIGQVLRCS